MLYFHNQHQHRIARGICFNVIAAKQTKQNPFPYIKIKKFNLKYEISAFRPRLAFFPSLETEDSQKLNIQIQLVPVTRVT